MFARDLAAGTAGVRQHGRDRLGVAGVRRRDDQGAAGRGEDRLRIPLIEPKRGETFGSQRGRRGPGRAGARRRQPPRPEAARADARAHPDRATRADASSSRRGSAWTAATTQRPTPASSPRQRGYTPHIRARGEEIKLKVRTPGWRARRWVVEAMPLLAEPQPRPPHPLVQEGREPPRAAPARQRPDRLQESTHCPARRPTGIGT